METLTIFALIVSLLILIKIIVILIKPKAWYNLAKTIWSAPTLVMIVCLVLSAIVLFYLIQTVTIIEIMAVMLFLALLSGMTMAVYSREILDFAGKLLKDRKFMKKAWLAIIIWLVLILWALKEILM
ncbi:hypothetical protein HYW76_04655 [Candidatus Pacearchaeota archaeon]|nr:hypothetical protein [Candidatus Pacearchaeota archaeon]